MPQLIKQIATITRVTASSHSAVGEVISGVSLLFMLPNTLCNTRFLHQEPCVDVEVFRLAVCNVGMFGRRALCVALGGVSWKPCGNYSQGALPIGWF